MLKPPPSSSLQPVTIKKNAKGIEFSTRKNKATPNAVKAAANTRQLSSGKPRKNAKTVYTATQKYRPDLTQVSGFALSPRHDLLVLKPSTYIFFSPPFILLSRPPCPV